MQEQSTAQIPWDNFPADRASEMCDNVKISSSEICPPLDYKVKNLTNKISDFVTQSSELSGIELTLIPTTSNEDKSIKAFFKSSTFLIGVIVVVAIFISLVYFDGFKNFSKWIQ